PTAPMTTVGQMSTPRVALYSDTLPETTGTPSASHAALMPATLRSSCHAPVGRSGLPRLRQSVIASGVAPTHTTLRIASATAAAAPTNGSTDATRGCASIATAMPSLRPLMRMTPASPYPGVTTVSVPTI